MSVDRLRAPIHQCVSLSASYPKGRVPADRLPELPSEPLARKKISPAKDKKRI